MSILKELSCVKVFNGLQKVFSHYSNELLCDMKFGIFLPAIAVDEKKKVPVIYFLSGLTCTEENFIQKSGFQKYADKHGVCVVNPDTSPRGSSIPDVSEYDFGQGAGFYLNATEAPWDKNFNMFNYVTMELVTLINNNFPVQSNKQSILGHSMGGHGALICALKTSGLYTSVSAFAPISNPIKCPWGQKAFKGYLGNNIEEWEKWDSTVLASKYCGVPIEIFIDQGSSDKFYNEKQLLPENLLEAAETNENIQTIYKNRDGYDHGYFYIATFIEEHVEYHAKYLKS